MKPRSHVMLGVPETPDTLTDVVTVCTGRRSAHSKAQHASVSTRAGRPGPLQWRTHMQPNKARRAAARSLEARSRLGEGAEDAVARDWQPRNVVDHQL